MADGSITPPGLTAVSKREMKSKKPSEVVERLPDLSRIELSSSHDGQKNSDADDKGKEVPCFCGDEAHKGLGNGMKNICDPPPN